MAAVNPNQIADTLHPERGDTEYTYDPKERAKQVLSIFQAQDHPASTVREKHDMDEIFENVFVGNDKAANNEEQLKKNNITHILNLRFQVHRRSLDMYHKNNIVFANVVLADGIASNLHIKINAILAFIHLAHASGGRVLIHCHMGKSRAPTVATAYLMLSRGMSVCDAARLTKRRVQASPHENYVHYLCALEKATVEHQLLQLSSIDVKSDHK